MTSFGFLPHILQPTRISDFSSTIIDNIYSNNLEQDSYSGNILIKFADHFSQLLSLNKAIMKFKPKSIYKRDYANYKEESFIEDVSIQTWNTNVQSDTNYKFNDFYWRLEGCIDRHAPLKKLNKKQLNKLSKPWINNSILKMIKHRDSLFQKKKKMTPLIFILRAHISYFVIVSQERLKKLKRNILNNSLKTI